LTANNLFLQIVLIGTNVGSIRSTQITSLFATVCDFAVKRYLGTTHPSVQWEPWVKQMRPLTSTQCQR